MDNVERANALIVDAHCRYCHNTGPDAHPAMKCNGDIVDLHVEIVNALDEAEKRGRLAAIEELRRWAKEAADMDGRWIDGDLRLPWVLAKLGEMRKA
jgi:hypothetical protein